MIMRHNKLVREERTIEAMIRIHCRGNHRTQGLCPECADLLAYAQTRLEKCPYGEEKPTCAQCSIHCYQSDMRERVRKVMRYSGPRMIFHHPILALYHLADSKGTRKS